MALDRKQLAIAARVEWAELRNAIVGDDYEQNRVYAEMVGWFSSADPVALSEFVANQQQRRNQIAAAVADEGDQ